MVGVAGLFSYPVKGCAGMALGATELTERGLAHDRTFLIVDEDGAARTQRGQPQLARIHPDIDPDGRRLTLSAAGIESFALAVDVTAPRRTVTMFGHPYRAIDQGDAVAAWLTEAIGLPSRLVRVPPEHTRVTDGLVPGTSAFADSCPIHILSVASLAGLNGAITARGSDPVALNRFRPNIVVDGWDEPHTEDRACRLTIADTALGFAKLAIRCAVTLVDQRHGVRVGPEPLRTLATYRRAAGGGVAFGAKFAVLRPGLLAVGDDVTVTEWSRPKACREDRGACREDRGACREDGRARPDDGESAYPGRSGMAEDPPILVGPE